MNDEKIFKIALTTTIIGLLGVMLLSGYVNPEKLAINKIDKSKIDNQIEVDATITSIKTTESGTKILTLTDNTGSINMVIFTSTDINTSIYKSMDVNIIARVTQYNNELELILEESKNFKIK